MIFPTDVSNQNNFAARFIRFFNQPFIKPAFTYTFINALILCFLYVGNAPNAAKKFQPDVGEWIDFTYNSYILYVSGSVAIAFLIGFLFLVCVIPLRNWSIKILICTFALFISCSLLLTFAYVNYLVFKSYGVHIYEFDILAILTDFTMQKDIGIRQEDVDSVFVVIVMLIVVEIGLYGVSYLLNKLFQALLIPLVLICLLLLVSSGFAGYIIFGSKIWNNNYEFYDALPLQRFFLFKYESRPFLNTELIPDAYPDVSKYSNSSIKIKDKKNIVILISDGLRADHVLPEYNLTPNIHGFVQKYDPLVSERHYSSSHYTDQGFFGLLYGLDAFHHYEFLQSKIPVFPLEVLKMNGYVTALFTHSFFNKFPTNWMPKNFDHAMNINGDDGVVASINKFVLDRRKDQKPYFVIGFVYTPHYPYDFKPEFTRYKPHRKMKYERRDRKLATRNSYKNSVLQTDDYFRQVVHIIKEDLEEGRTIFLFTSDHGTELWDHDTIIGQGKSTFWNEKVLVPFILAYSGVKEHSRANTIPVSSHVDIWPTLFDLIKLDSEIKPELYSGGVSLLSEISQVDRNIIITGRLFPYANRSNAIVDKKHKFWFRVTGLKKNGKLTYRIIKQLDLDDQEVSGAIDISKQMAWYNNRLWRFLQPVSNQSF